MDSYPPRIQRNPITHERHRREVFRQITLPLIIALVVIAVLVGLTVTASAAGASRWADISLIWLIMPVLVVSLIFLILLSGITYGLIRLIGVLPRYALQVQDFFVLLHFQIARLNDKITQPVIKLHATSASVKSLLRRVRGDRKPAPRRLR